MIVENEWSGKQLVELVSGKRQKITDWQPQANLERHFPQRTISGPSGCPRTWRDPF